LSIDLAFILVDQRHSAAWGGFTAYWLAAVRRQKAPRNRNMFTVEAAASLSSITLLGTTWFYMETA